MFQQLRKAREEGFTLIELLIVVLVLGILAAIVLFALGTFTSDSKKSACQTDKKSLETALAAYAAQHSGTFPTSPDYTNIVPNYLRQQPSSTNGYTFTWDASGNVTSSGTNSCG